MIDPSPEQIAAAVERIAELADKCVIYGPADQLRDSIVQAKRIVALLRIAHNGAAHPQLEDKDFYVRKVS